MGAHIRHNGHKGPYHPNLSNRKNKKTKDPQVLRLECVSWCPMMPKDPRTFLVSLLFDDEFVSWFPVMPMDPWTYLQAP